MNTKQTNTKHVGKYASNEKTKFNILNLKFSLLDVRLWLPVFIVVLIVALNINTRVVTERLQENFDETLAIWQSLDEETPSITDVTIPEPTISQEEQDIIALARLADTVGRDKNDEVKTIIMWIAINRVEDHRNGYGLSLQEEIARPKQWQQYDPEGMYLETTYGIAYDVYNTWKSNGPRPIYNDMLWFAFNDNGTITVRNQYKDTKNRSELTFGYGD